MGLPKLWVGKNLSAEVLELGEPWEFNVEEGHPTLDKLVKLSKKSRRDFLSKESCDWQIYSAFSGHAPNQRINDQNPPRQMNALVVDFDRKAAPDQVLQLLEEWHKSLKVPGGNRPVALPNFVEITLSENIRLVWVFERPVNLKDTAFAADFWDALQEHLKFDQILLGYDKASSKPSQVWTNGGTWHDLDQPPVSWKWLLGLMLEVSKRSQHDGTHTIPLPLIADEFEKRWPGKWKGEFKLDETGARIWDDKADNPSGCQIKEDGMLCFTGPFPFRSWSDILGKEWVRANTELNNGKLIEEFRYAYKDRDYYQLENGLWTSMSKDDLTMRLRNRGVCGKILKGEQASQMDGLMEMIQCQNKVLGVGPIVSQPPGVIVHKGEKWINTASIKVVQSMKGPAGTWEDCGFICRIEEGFNTDKRGLALATLRAWNLRTWRSQRDYKRLMGQALFICGQRNTGKTLYATHVQAAMLGGTYSNPFRYFTGQTNFNIQLFGCPLLMVNDEEAPATDSERRKLHARIKSSVVNPTQEVEAKFHTPTIVDWTGRIVWTLNDDAGDVYQFPEVTPSIEDKVMFLRMLNTGIQWGERNEIEAQIAKELPHYLWCLENILETPKEIIEPGRMGLKSYFDPQLRKWSLQNTDAYSILELLEQWIKLDDHWRDNSGNETENDRWVGSAAELMTLMHSHDQLKPLLHGVTAKSLPKALTTLSKLSHSGVTLDSDARRHFIIYRGLAEQE